MTDKTRFLLGYSQKLPEYPFKGGGGDFHRPWSIEQQRDVLIPQLNAIESDSKKVPAAARPDGQVVAVIRLHPSALSRSAFPEALFSNANLRLLGSKSTRGQTPELRPGDTEDLRPRVDLFVAGTPKRFRDVASLLLQATDEEEDALGANLRTLESVRLMDSRDRVKPIRAKGTEELEIVLHYDSSLDAQWRQSFSKYAEKVGVILTPGLEIARRGLLFLAADGTRDAAEELAQFTFLRTVRPLPEPIVLEQPTILRASTPRSILPAGGPVDPNCRMAIFDGGLPVDHPFGAWVQSVEPPPGHDIGPPVAAGLQHGLAVTSAALFGSITPGIEAQRPYCRIDHHRIVGTNTIGRKGQMRMIMMIDDVLEQRRYDVVSLSVGPQGPIDDDRVDYWTTILDDHFSRNQALGVVAVGNTGEKPFPASRVEAPSDSVNALGVGACSDMSGPWERAPYSSIGPGRVPGVIKPDLVCFGGTTDRPFFCAGPKGQVLQICGTSFAAPTAGRVAAGVRAHFGSTMTSMASKAVMLNSAKQDGHEQQEVGLGRIPPDLAEFVVCKPGSVRVVYQGTLRPGGMVRAPITIPSTLSGDVFIRATVCYTCATDPHTPGEYTRAAIEVAFRPNASKFNYDKKTKKYSTYAKTAPFFAGHDYLEEYERREKAQKWNTVMHAEHPKRASAMEKPVFDLHYVARAPGVCTTPGGAQDIKYALVVTIEREKSADLYEQVVAEFENLEAMQPVIDITAEVPVRVT